MAKAPDFRMSISYDVASDLFSAKLENGAQFTFSRSDVGGKLNNSLELYRKGVIAFSNENTYVPKDRSYSKEEERRFLEEAMAGKPISIVGVKKILELNLDDLEI